MLQLFTTTLLNIARCGTSIALSLHGSLGSIADEAIWLALKTSLLAAELCVLFFGLLSGA